MAGEDTMRGVGFQHAAAVLACIDAVSDPRVSAIVLEGGDDVIDVLAKDTSGQALWARQLKTRSEPHNWRKNDLVAILRSWSAVQFSRSVPFGFVTDGQLSAGAMELAQNISDGRFESAAAATNLPAETLELVSIRSRVPSAPVLLEQAELHLIRRGEPFVSTDDATARVNGLLRRILIASGDATEEQRTLTVEELSLDLGLLPARLRATAPAAVGEAVVTIQRTELVKEAIDRLQFGNAVRGRVALWGFSGFGKSTLAEQIYEEVTTGSRNAILVPLDSHDDAHGVLARVASYLRGRPPTDFALAALAAEVAGLSASVDLLICDNVASEDAAAVLAASVAPRTALLVTKRSHHVPPTYDTIEVGPLKTEEVEAILNNVLPGRDLHELAHHIHGWPLLLDLVRTSLRRHIDSGGDPDHVVLQHLVRLRDAGPPDFDDAAKATSAAVVLALEAITSLSQTAGRALGVLQTSQPQPISLLAALWNTDTETARSHAVALASVALVRLEGRGKVAVHDALIATLHALLDRQERRTLHLRLADYHSLPSDAASYYLVHTPDHLAAAGIPEEAMRLLANADWCTSVATHLGTPLHLSRQAHVIAESIRRDKRDPGLLLTAVVLCRLYGTQFAVDHRVARLFAAVHGVELTETLLRSAGVSKQSAMAHAELAEAFIRSGKISDAERNAKASLSAARHSSDPDLPDTLLVAVQKLGRGATEWIRSSVEAIEYAIEIQEDRPGRYFARAVATSTLLPLDPDIAWQIALPLVERLRTDIRSDRSLASALGADDACDTIRNVLPVIAYKDVDFALILAEQAALEGLMDADAGSYLLPGRLLGGAELTDTEFEKLAANDVVSLNDLAVALARRRRYGDIARIVDAVPSRRVAARMHASVGQVMHENAEAKDMVDAQFDKAIGLLHTLSEADIVSLLPVLASNLSQHNPVWAHKLARQAVQHAWKAPLAHEGVSIEGSALAILADIDPKSVDTAIDDLLLRASATRFVADPASGNAAMEMLVDHLYGAVVSQPGPLPLAQLIASRQVVTSESPRYWARWADRLAETKDAASAAALFGHPDFSSWTTYVSGAASWATALVIDKRSNAEWQATTEGFPLHVRDAYTVELELLRLTMLGTGSHACSSRLARLDNDLDRGRGYASVDALRAIHAGRPADALRHILATYSLPGAGGIVVRSPSVGAIRLHRIPLALKLALNQRISIADVSGALSQYEYDNNVAAFLSDVVPMTVDLSVDGVEAISRSVQLPTFLRWEWLLAPLDVVLRTDPTSVSRWLRQRPTREDDWSGGISIEDWCDLAWPVLSNGLLSFAERNELIVEARRRFAKVTYGAETPEALYVLVAVAPDDPDQARQLVERGLSSFLVGPATCALANLRASGNQEWTHDFIRGLAMSGTLSVETAWSIGSILGQVTADAGSERLWQLADAGGLDLWPGEVAGAAGGMAAMADMITRNAGAETVLDMVSLLRGAGDVAAGFFERSGAPG